MMITGSVICCWCRYSKTVKPLTPGRTRSRIRTASCQDMVLLVKQEFETFSPAPPATCCNLPTTTPPQSMSHGTRTLLYHWVVDSSQQVLLGTGHPPAAGVP